MFAFLPLLAVTTHEINAPRWVAIDVARSTYFRPPLGRNFARRLAQDGSWRSLKIGRRLLVDLESVRAWAEAAQTGAPKEEVR
jgi:hypothetical protein